MRVGYARVSTSDQNPELQLDALRRAGCDKVFTEKASGARDDRPELARILEDVLRAGDTLVVWKLVLRRQVAAWKAEQTAIHVPRIVKAAEVRQEIISPARDRLRDAERELARTKERTGRIAAKRTSLASFIRDPQRAIWAKIREVHAMDKARRELARARAEVRVREAWLRSEQGRGHVLARVDQSHRAAQPAKAGTRSLERKIRRVGKRIRTVERVMERVQVAEQLGLKSVTRPVTVRDPTQLLRRIDATATQLLSRASPQQLQQARQQVRSLARGIGMGFSR